MAILVHLVSDQLLPAVLPIMELRPTRLVLLYSNDRYLNAATQIAVYCSKRNLIIESIYERVDAFDPDDTYEKVFRIAEYHPDAVVNVTGGTKLMAFGAYRAATEKGLGCLYVDTHSDRYRVVGGEIHGLVNASVSSARLSVEDFYDLYGGKVVEKRSRQYEESRLLPFWQLVAQNWATWASTFREFANGQSVIAPKADRSDHKNRSSLELKLLPQKAQQNPLYEHLEQMHKRLRLIKSINYGSNGDGGITVTFASDEAFRMMRKQGDWLEGLVYHLLRELEHGDSTEGSSIPPGLISDVQAAVKFRWDAANGSSPLNEFDVIAVVGARLIVISCKTGKVDDDAIFEMESVSRIGGLFARKVLVSAYPVESRIVQRARRMGTEVIELRELLKVGARVLLGNLVQDPN